MTNHQDPHPRLPDLHHHSTGGGTSLRVVATASISAEPALPSSATSSSTISASMMKSSGSTSTSTSATTILVMPQQQQIPEEQLENSPSPTKPANQSQSDTTLPILIRDRSASRPNKACRRTLSDLALIMNMPEAAVAETRRRRENNASDMIARNGYAPSLGYADLHLAEALQESTLWGTTGAFGVNDSKSKQHIFMEEPSPTDGPSSTTDHHPSIQLTEKGLSSQEAKQLLDEYGRNEIPEKFEPKWLIFVRLLLQPMPIMIWIAIIIEASINNWLDMGLLLCIQFINSFISFHEINRAGDAVGALRKTLKPTATVFRDGKFQVMDAALLVPGDTISLASGSAVPADCRINHGEIDADQSALTGESIPVTMYKGDSVKMGSTIVRGEVHATVEFTGLNTFFGKTATLLKQPRERSRLQSTLLTIMIVLVALSCTLCTINFFYLEKRGKSTKEALHYTIVVLVASIPLAMEIVTTATLAIGSRSFSKMGAIVTRLAAIEDLASMGILCTDKTGTLTLNKLALQDDTPIFSPGETQESLLVNAALAAKWHEPPHDALDRLVFGSVNMSSLEPYEQLDFIPFDPVVKRTESKVRDKRTGSIFRTSKGAPHIIMSLLLPDDTEAFEQVEYHVSRLGQNGYRSLAVARTDADGIWRVLGLLTFLDPPRPDSKQMIHDTRELGVAVKMITGDHLLIARNTAETLDLGPLVFGPERLPMLDPETKAKPTDLGKKYGDLCLTADGFAQVYPEHKYLVIECLRELKITVGMIGEGVNDAPALKRADVGIAVGGATDAARAAADIIFLQEGLDGIIGGIRLAREVFSRVNHFITYRIASTLQLLLFFFVSIFLFHPSEYRTKATVDEAEWPPFFEMPVLMLLLITLLNDGTLITIAYDYAEASDEPSRWNLPALFVSSSVLGLVSFGSSLLLLHYLLESWNPDGLFQRIGLPPLRYGHVTTAIYLKISVSDFLTLFSARTGRSFFWQVKPAPILFGGAIFALGLSSILSIFWPISSPDNVPTEGLKGEIGVFFFVWAVCLIFWLIQDLLKVGTYGLMYKANAFNITRTGAVVLPDSTRQMIAEVKRALDDSNVFADGTEQ